MEGRQWQIPLYIRMDFWQQRIFIGKTEPQKGNSGFTDSGGRACGAESRPEIANAEREGMSDASGSPVVLVTGGAQGIGKGIVHHLLEAGYRITVADQDAEAGGEAIRRLGKPNTLHFRETDVGEEAQVRAVIADTLEHFGRLDGLVNNAGISDPDSGPVETLALSEWERVIRTNLTGYFLTVKHAAVHLRASRGAVVNIASTRAFQSEPDTLAYAASKGGVVSLTHAMAVSLGPEIRVNCISPGWIDVSDWKKGGPLLEDTLRPSDHEQHPVGRVGRPEDVAAMTVFLLSRSAGFITGANMTVDGGMSRRMIYLE